MSLKAKTTRVESAYERLKSEILRGELPPGFQAPEPEIAGRLGMSRTPVREALIRLEAERLVDLVPRRGAKVLPISQKEFCDIFEILAVLGALAARKAAARDLSNGDFPDMSGVLDDADGALAAGDIEAWARIDDRFHRLLARGSGNVRLEGTITGLLDQVYRANMVLLRLNKAPAADPGDHRLVVEALKAGQGEAAAGIVRDNRLSALQSMKRLLDISGLLHV